MGALEEEEAAIELEASAPLVEIEPDHALVGDDGRLIDRGELARGGMATVRRVFDRNIRREVAVKRVGAAHREVSDALPFLVEEAQITGQLEHPNIVPVYDLGIDPGGEPMFAMRLVQGYTLTKAMRDYWKGGRNPIELRDLLDVLLKVCDAVAYAHSRGVVHRDLKPDNVMIGSHGQVYVMDWGCALLLAGSDAQLPGGVRSRRAAPDVLLGTASYMAPEQAKGEIGKVDARTDVYALGSILYQVLVERPPHRAPDFAQSVRLAQLGAPVLPAEARPDLDLPPQLVAIVERAIAHAPEDRYPSVESLRADLDRFVGGIDWFSRRRFAAGDVIVRQGDDAYTAYAIESGSCEEWRDGQGARTVVQEYGRGDVFGVTALFTDGVRSTTVVALDDVVCIEITRSAFEQRIGVDSWLGLFIRSLARRIREDERRREDSGAGALYVRIVDAVLVQLELGNGVAVWSALRRGVARVLGVEELQVTLAVRSAGLVIDTAADRIRR